MSKTLENTNKLLQFIHDKYVSGEIDDEGLVQIIELCGDYLNLMTISGYAKKNSMSYNGVKKHRDVRNLFGCKFVVDNE